MIVADARFRQWLEKRIGVTLPPDAQFIGCIRNGEAIVAVGFTHYQPGVDIHLSVAGERGSGSRSFLAAVFGYVFDQLQCVRCTVRVRASNARAIKLAKRLGFVQEGVLRLGYGDEDALIFGLLRTDYVERRR